MTEKEMEKIINEEAMTKRQCLYALERALHYAGKNCSLTYDEPNEAVNVFWHDTYKIDHVNVACDNAMAMMYDIFKQVLFYER